MKFLSDGAIASLREDLAEAEAGVPMVLAWNYVSGALEEIEWLREREWELEKKLREGGPGVVHLLEVTATERDELKRRVTELEEQLHEHEVRGDDRS